jgi:predicted RNA-binding protein with PUA-like domain
MKTQIWLMKSEPETYSFETLKKDKATWWTGVRNYQARNFMMKDMKVGDLVLFYHSSCDPAGIAGLAEVTKAAEPDATQFDKKSDFFDPKATKDKPIWYCVQVGYKKDLKSFVNLSDLRNQAPLKDMVLLQKGSRLSIQPVGSKHLDVVLKMAGTAL